MSYFRNLANECLRNLTPYQPGKPIEELQRELGLTNIIKLASNENPLGPSPKILATLKDQMHDLARYPDGSGYYLKNVLAEKFSIDMDRITLGSGSENILQMIAQVFIAKNSEVIVSQYAFSTYKILTQTHQGVPIEIPSKDWGCDLTAMAKAITDKTVIIYIANPNNPTGTWFTHQQLATFLRQIPKHIIVVMDEAYYDYIDHSDYPDSLALQNDHANLIVTRTFSKIYGLAGCRIGFSMSHPEIADLLNRVREPFNVSSFAMKAAMIAIQDLHHVQEGVRINNSGKDQLIKMCHKLNLNFIPSMGNFITIDFGPKASQIYQQLLTKGIILRPLVPYQLPNHLRVTVGLPEELAVFETTLADILAYV